ncbi:cilia- and flagella-associated protein 91 [Rhincodon typus]|uniref:cilia- and flagella-associated protein 91 n=1 Tax=Rhincodon typus TaxID=259920 RepID=UPI0020305BC1|nr:cilia- and flagella-associated protein 91 [Rhincodon typus]
MQKKVPDYKTMFSNLEHFPSYTVQLDYNDSVPKFVDQRWRGYREKKQEAIKQLAAHDPSLKMQLQVQEDPQVSGKNRYKYFTRPVIPFVQQLPVNAILDVSKGGTPNNITSFDNQFLPIRTVGVQTDYRDSETQTEPYSPEYVVLPGSAPELLTLAALKFGRGLPAGLAEVEMIERARAKRAWEATLPPLSDRSQLEKRKRMMEAMERNEWAFREQEIEKLQEIRLDVLMHLLSQREGKQQEMNVKRVDTIWSKLQQKKGVAIKKIRLKHIKEIRKITAKRRNVEGKLERRNRIQDYADYGSQVYAPVSRNGRFPDQNSERFIVKSHFLSTFNGILELEETLPDFVTQPRIRIQRPKKTTKHGTLNYAARREMELAKIHKAIREAKFKGAQPEKPLRFLFKTLKSVPRPPTPTVEQPPEVVKVHQTSVDSYLEDILLKSVQYTAEDQARQEIRKMADEINDIAYKLEQHRTELQSEEIVSELVHGFLIPEAHKVIMRDRVKHFQSRHLLVAHRIIHNEAERIMTNTASAASASSRAAEDVMNQVLTEVEKEMKMTQGS